MANSEHRDEKSLSKRRAMDAPQDLKIFISSPSDVRPERLRAMRLVEKLGREFRHYFRLESVLWEREPLRATEHFQKALIPPREADIVVVILWSRLGVMLPEDQFLGAITHRPVTGTEWEFEDAFKAYRESHRPDLLLYLKTAELKVSLEDEDALQRHIEQKRRVKDFLERWFFAPEVKTFKLAYTAFADTAGFEEALETHLRRLLKNRVNPANGDTRRKIRWHRGSPYRGLQSFELEHAQIFFGRTRARNELRTSLAGQVAAGCAFVLVLGASGSGKSSLVKAGLLADLQLPGMIGQVAACRYAVLQPADARADLIDALATALLAPTALPELLALQYDPRSLATALRDASNHARQALLQALTQAARKEQLDPRGEVRLVLIVDQLEELFTLEGLAPEHINAFVAVLEALARSGLVWIIATMRGDFFDQLGQFPTLAKLSAGEATYRLLPPTPAEISDIVRQPAREAGLSFELDAVTGIGLDDILCEAAAMAPSALPLLEFTLEQLWHQHTADTDELTFAAYREMNGLEGALGRRAEEVFCSLPEDVRGALPQVLRAVATVAPGVGSEVSARTFPLAEFPVGSPPRRLVEAFLHPRARLLVAGTHEPGAPLVRVAHEALLTHWQRAREQLLVDRSDLQTRSRLEQAMALWQSAPPGDRASRLLPRGLPLEEALDLMRRRREELTLELVEYVTKSAAAVDTETLRSRRRLQGTVVVLTVLALGAGVAGIFAYLQSLKSERQAEIALARQLAAQANLLADRATDAATIERAAALAVESWKRLPSAEASSVAAKAIKRLPSFLIKYGEPIEHLAISLDGRVAATASRDKILRIIETASGKELARIDHEASIKNVAVSPDTRMAATSASDVVRLFDIASGAERVHIKVPAVISKLTFSPDSRYLVTADEDNRVRLVDVVSGREFAPIDHIGEVGSLVFSPDSRFLATAARQFWTGEIHLIETITGKRLATFSGLFPVTTVSFSPDSRFLASASWDAMVLAESATGREIARTAIRYQASSSFAFSPDSRFFAALAGLGTARLIDTVTGQDLSWIGRVGAVSRIAFSPDGQLLATAGSGIAYLFDTASGAKRFENYLGEPATALAFSPDGRFLAAAGKENTAQLFRTADGAELTSVKHDATITHLVFSPDSRFLVITSDDPKLSLISTAKPQDIISIDHAETVGNVLFSPDSSALSIQGARSNALISTSTGKTLARISHTYSNENRFSADSRFLAMDGDDNTAVLIDATDGRELARVQPEEFIKTYLFSADSRVMAAVTTSNTVALIGTRGDLELARVEHESFVKSVAFSPDSRFLATGSWDKTARLIDIGTGQVFAQIEHNDPVYGAEFSPDSRLLATTTVGWFEGGVTRRMRVSDTANGRDLADGVVDSVSFGPNGRLLATKLDGKTVRLIDITEARELARYEHGDIVNYTGFSPDGQFLGTGSNDKTARLFDTVSTKELARIEHGQKVDRVEFSPDSHLAITISDDDVVRLVDTTTGQERTPVKHGGSHAGPLAFSPDSRILVVTDGHLVRLVDTASGRQFGEIRHEERVTKLAFAPGGRSLVTGTDDNTVSLVDAANGNVRTRLKHRATVETAFSADSRFLMTGSGDGTAHLIDIAKGKELRRVEHDGPVEGVVFSPDSRFVATQSKDKTTSLVETANGREVMRIEHLGPVKAIAFSLDSRFLVTGSEDKTVRFTDTANGHDLMRIELGGAATGLFFSPDGRFLAIRSDENIESADGRSERANLVQLFWADPQHLFDRLCQKAGRNLTQAEWKAYISVENPRPSCGGWRSDTAAAKQPSSLK